MTYIPQWGTRNAYIFTFVYAFCASTTQSEKMWARYFRWKSSFSTFCLKTMQYIIKAHGNNIRANHTGNKRNSLIQTKPQNIAYLDDILAKKTAGNHRYINEMCFVRIVVNVFIYLVQVCWRKVKVKTSLVGDFIWTIAAFL